MNMLKSKLPIAERRKRIMAFKANFVYNKAYSSRWAIKFLQFKFDEELHTRNARMKATITDNEYLASLFELPLLTHEAEVALFHQYNCAKMKFSKLRDKLPSRPSSKDLQPLEELMRIATEASQLIVSRNLRLVVATSKRYKNLNLDMMDILAEGNLGLFRAMEKFDVGLNIRFSTYATYAIQSVFVRLYRTLQKELPHYSFCHEDGTPLSVPDCRQVTPDDLAESSEAKALIIESMEVLDDREKQIIRERYGIGDIETLTLDSLGEKLNITKERVRQLQNRAIHKLTKVLYGLQPDSRSRPTDTTVTPAQSRTPNTQISTDPSRKSAKTSGRSNRLDAALA